MANDVDVRQELLERVRAHQASINAYVRKMRGRRTMMANISIVSSSIATALTVGPAVSDDKFTETVQKGLGWESDSGVYRLLCLAALIVNLAAAISTALNKSNDPTERINIAEASNAALEGLRADVEFSQLSVKTAAAEYRQIVSRILLIPVNPADHAAGGSDNEASASRTPLPNPSKRWPRGHATVHDRSTTNPAAHERAHAFADEHGGAAHFPQGAPATND